MSLGVWDHVVTIYFDPAVDPAVDIRDPAVDIRNPAVELGPCSGACSGSIDPAVGPCSGY